MAFSPIAFTVPEYDKTLFRNWWLKAYEPGTTTAKSMAVDAAGSSQASRFQIDSEGFPITAGDSLVIPYINGSYDLWLFPTAAEADANDTTNARQFADNVTIPETPNFTEEVADLTNINFATVAALKADTTVKVGDFVTIESYTATNNSGTMHGEIVAAATGTDDGGSYIDLAGSGLQFKQHLVSPYNVKHWGAEGDGVQDDAPMVRAALDFLPARGGVVEYPDAGPYLHKDVVYIPQRTTVFGGPGVVLKGNNTSIIGSGSNTIFESGTGEFSTVAKGGATNFGQPDESVASIHYNSGIEGFNFSNCGDVIRVFNWIQGCYLKDLYATDFDIMITTDRCFYLALEDIQGRPLDETRLATTPILRFFDNNNTMTFKNVHVSGVTPTAQRKGIGWLFDGGVQSIDLDGSCSVEGCVTGLELRSFIFSLNLGMFFEFNDTHIKSTGATLFNTTIDNCWFDAGTAALNVDNWISGKWGAGNHLENSAQTVTFGLGCTNEVELPTQALTELNHTTWVDTPANYTIGGGCKVTRNDMIFNSSLGFSAPWFRNSSDSSGGEIVPLAYSGQCFNVGNTIPYCTVTGVGTGTLTIDTKIKYNVNLSAIRFDLLVAHSMNSVVAGVLSANNTVFRDDADAAVVTPSNNGGFLRLTITGFGTITSFSGKVRVI